MVPLINPKWGDDMASGYDVELAKLNTCKISKDMSFFSWSFWFIPTNV